MARADFDALRLHIEANRIYYMNQIWRAEDPNTRFERFRQMGIEAFVENRLIGFVGERASLSAASVGIGHDGQDCPRAKVDCLRSESGRHRGIRRLSDLRGADSGRIAMVLAADLGGLHGRCSRTVRALGALPGGAAEYRATDRTGRGRACRIRVADARGSLSGPAPIAITAPNP